MATEHGVGMVRAARAAIAAAATAATTNCATGASDGLESAEWDLLASAATAGVIDALEALDGVESVADRSPEVRASTGRAPVALRVATRGGATVDVALRQGGGSRHPRSFAATDVLLEKADETVADGADGDEADGKLKRTAERPRPTMPRRHPRDDGTTATELAALARAEAGVPVTKVLAGLSAYAFGGDNRSPKLRDTPRVLGPDEAKE